MGFNEETNCSYLTKIEMNFIDIATTVVFLIEVVPEDMEIKQPVFKRLNEIYKKKNIFVMIQTYPLFAIRKTEMGSPTKLIAYIPRIKHLKQLNI